MAQTVPETIRGSATAGERLLFRTLKAFLPDDYIVYYEPDIHGRKPDFVILGPDLGMIILEVKDYTKNTLVQLNPNEWTIQPSSGKQTQVKSPLLQARENAFHVVNILKQDGNLLHTEGKYKHGLKFPYGYGTVFTRLSQKDFIENGLYSVIPPELCLTRNEIDPESDSFSEEWLIEKLLGMFTVFNWLKEPLTKQEMDAIRYHLFPEIRISAKVSEGTPYQDKVLLSLHDIRAMDLNQENLAKQLGDGNRLIRGVAGSGKTLILASRARLLIKENPEWKVLILCYNISLARNIRQLVHHMVSQPENLFDFDFTKEDPEVGQGFANITVRHFHEWLRQDLHLKEEGIPAYLDEMNAGKVSPLQYDAILIDEGQDFEAEWFQLASRMVNPDTKSLLLVEDRAQAIYKRKRSYSQDTGMDFRGRSRILTINYRNTAQIVKFAWDFYRQFSSLKNKVITKEMEAEIISPQSTPRRGPEPAILATTSFAKEAAIVARQILKLHKEKKIAYSEILILYRVKAYQGVHYADSIRSALQKQGIPHYWVTENFESKRQFDRTQDTVKISTIDSSKGMEFKAVFLVNVDNMPFALEEDKEREAALLYIGMTRAQEYLCLSYSGSSEFTAYFEQVPVSQEQK